MLEDHADRFVVSAFAGWIGGFVSLYLGLLARTAGDWSDAERFAAAAAAHERARATALLARTRLEWARMLLIRCRSGDTHRARHLLGLALTAARELGLANVEPKAVDLLASQ
jgi:hypothetical protein